MLRSDIPLDRDAMGMFLPAIIGFMIFLGGLALAGSMALENFLTRWRLQIESTLTVELPTIEGESATTAAARRQAAVQAIAAAPGAQQVHLLSEAERAQLLTPWLGPDTLSLDLPLPDLVSVTLAPGAQLGLSALTARLAAVSPGAIFDDHGRWRSAVIGVSQTAQLATLAFLLVIGAAASLTVVFVARAGLASHRRVIEIMHLIGAHDGYVAGQFQRYALVRALLGGGLGTALSAGAFEAGRHLLPGLIDAGFALAPRQWAAIAFLPIAGALLAMATARFTVLGTMRKMA
jgi:cell division transport system permease protein